jgi:hypothetical protein
MHHRHHRARAENSAAGFFNGRFEHSSFIALAGARERAGARRGVKATSARGLPWRR